MKQSDDVEKREQARCHRVNVDEHHLIVNCEARPVQDELDIGFMLFFRGGHAQYVVPTLKGSTRVLDAKDMVLARTEVEDRFAADVPLVEVFDEVEVAGTIFFGKRPRVVPVVETHTPFGCYINCNRDVIVHLFGVTSSCLCKGSEGAVFPLQVEGIRTNA